MSGQTLIYGAIINHHEDIIRQLIFKGANINVMDDEGFTPLYSILDQSVQALHLVPLLLELGADLCLGMGKIQDFLSIDRPNLEVFFNYVVKYLEKLEEDEIGNERQLRKIADQVTILSKFYDDKLFADVFEKAKYIRFCLGLENVLDKSDCAQIFKMHPLYAYNPRSLKYLIIHEMNQSKQEKDDKMMIHTENKYK